MSDPAVVTGGCREDYSVATRSCRASSFSRSCYFPAILKRFYNASCVIDNHKRNDITIRVFEDDDEELCSSSRPRVVHE